MIKELIYDSNRMHSGELKSRLGNLGSVGLGSTNVMVTLPDDLKVKVGDQVLLSRLGNKWTVINKISSGGTVKEVKV
ncbi:hypothetical protein MBAV_000120 [Candidatus Magnetobacterium bavaricum]|uniref:Uncharacterized protein n=1 Tax=Candidatus Magnetobacterium bavaricum TaxID=29290 RepID=A0A0F3H0M1_9BACT|nr:hypothetical protein MBAV_000120 [Candidatus Magnetobacterium bavaricum]